MPACAFTLWLGYKADPPSKSVLYFSLLSPLLSKGRKAFCEQSILNHFSVYSHPRSDHLKWNLPNGSHCIQTAALSFHPPEFCLGVIPPALRHGPRSYLFTESQLSGLPPPWSPAGCPHLPAPSVLCSLGRFLLCSSWGPE